jgi:hypothetical protein
VDTSGQIVRRGRRERQSGFALLLVFLMAAVIAISLYSEIPRVAFESERQKELLLIDRGEQYKRAIQLFVKKNSRYPAKLEELESFNNRRYLRRRFRDPMTGKDEWKLIKINAAGVLENSLVNKSKGADDKKSTYSNTFIGEGPVIGGGTGAAQAVNPALRRRPSEGGKRSPQLGPDGFPIQPGTGTSTIPDQTADTAAGQTAADPSGQAATASSGQTGTTATGQSAAGALPGASTATGTTATATQTGSTSSSSSGSSYVGGSQAYIGGGSYIGGSSSSTSSATTSGTSSSGGSASVGSSASAGFQQPGSTTGTTQSSAAMSLIQNILTTPRPGGMPTSNAAMQGMQLGPGIAGVASTAEGEGVLIYNEHTNFEEWEFIYDPTKEKRIPNPAAGTVGTSASQSGSSSGSSSQSTSSFGSSSFGSGTSSSTTTGNK